MSLPDVLPEGVEAPLERVAQIWAKMLADWWWAVGQYLPEPEAEQPVGNRRRNSA